MRRAKQIGNAIVQLVKPGCVDYPLIDTDPTTPMTEPECQAIERVPCANIGQGGCLQTGFAETRLNECRDGQGNILDPPSLDPRLF